MSDMSKNNLVTIAIPTYKRPELIINSLKSLEKQTTKNFQIFISVNGDERNNSGYEEIEHLYRNNNKVSFFYQNKNIGSIKNFLFLLSKCQTKYFMWLADDDTVSPECLEILVDILDKNKDAVTAVPYWERIIDDKIDLIVPSHFHQDNILSRIIKFCAKTDDVFFYGLHKTENIKKCSFKDFWKPNKELISQWAYIYIFDLLFQGKIIFRFDERAKWTNNHSFLKQYSIDRKSNLFSNFKYIIKEININYQYIFKIIKWKKFHFLPIMFFLLTLFFFRKLFKLAKNKIFKKKT